MKLPPALVLAGTHSGVGKTTVAIGLMAALRRRGLRVAPFKVGPDYLDPTHHRAACGQSSSPLDLWMLGEAEMRQSFARSAAGADLALIEGMMGLYDGSDPVTETGSTAQVAKLLGVPVVLVLDGSAVARSAGAVVLGYRGFDPAVRLAGVVANRVSGTGHAGWLRPSIEEGAGLPLLGWLPPDPDLALPERHLGLIPASEESGMPGLPSRLERLAEVVEQHVDLDALLRLAAPPVPFPAAEIPSHPSKAPRQTVRLGVARDAAFCFYYADNLALLEACGAELVEFSPLRDHRLPDNLGGLYLGGGYPELHAAALAANASLRAEIRAFAAAGHPVFAEGGGFIYLCERLIDQSGHSHPMVGVAPGWVEMTDRLQSVGYREAVLCRDGCLGPRGLRLRGHEFRCSRHHEAPGAEASDAAFFATDAGRAEIGLAGHAEGNVIASYVHVHFASAPQAAVAFIRACVAAER